MRWILRLLLVLLVAGWLAGKVPSAQTRSDRRLEAQRPSEMQWRKTRDGWERPTWLNAQVWPSSHERSRRPAIHPVVVGLMEVLLVLTAALAFSPQGDRRAVRRQMSRRAAGQPCSPRLGP